MIWGISLLLISILAVPSLLFSKKPNTKELLEKIEPCQGWFELLFCFWGVSGIVSTIQHSGWFATYPILWVSLLTNTIIVTISGFVLGFGLIHEFFLSKNETANEFREKLAPKQANLEFFRLKVGSWIVAPFLFFT